MISQNNMYKKNNKKTIQLGTQKKTHEKNTINNVQYNTHQ